MAPLPPAIAASGSALAVNFFGSSPQAFPRYLASHQSDGAAHSTEYAFIFKRTPPTSNCMNTAATFKTPESTNLHPWPSGYSTTRAPSDGRWHKLPFKKSVTTPATVPSDRQTTKVPPESSSKWWLPRLCLRPNMISPTPPNTSDACIKRC